MPDPPSESLGQTQSIRRSVTLPTKLNPQAQRVPNLGENVIFYHPSAKIVQFAPKALFPIPTSSTPTDFDYPVDTIETLPWRSATERTVATAPLRLEKVHGLTVFLKCGHVVHAILKNSQCWCVDGVSKFVLRIRPLTYYRIEIPFETEDDKRLVGQLKAALPTVLRYEVTPCPFKRAFTVELPEDAVAPRRKRAWQPKGQRDSLLSLSGSAQGPPSEAGSEGPDSVSAGDTDGAATDDSGFVLKGAESTTSEALSVDDPSLASIDAFDAPVHPKTGRRAVTETPQTFSTLRAKFDTSPVREQSPISDDSVRERDAQNEIQEDSKPSDLQVLDCDIPEENGVAASTTTDDVSLAPSSLAETRSSELTPEQEVIDPPIASATEDDSSSASRAPAGLTRTRETSDQVADMRQESPLQFMSSREEPLPQNTGSEARALSSNLESTSSESHSLKEPHSNISSPSGDEGTQQLPIHEQEEHITFGPDPDDESSFSSSPDSFHSADFSPIDSLSPHTLPHDTHNNANQQTWPPYGPLSATKMSSEAPETSLAIPPGVSPSSDIPNSSGQVAASSKFAFYETRKDTPKPSLAIPSESRRPSQASAKTVSPAPNLNEMSTEFRRRAQATRQRDVSPMPPLSTIYQPTPSEGASSILTKALALVLVPPISLFIILLHITARIVISPTFDSNNNTSPKASHTSDSKIVTEDDFSFPLEGEASSDYEDAEMSRKSDPWDLD